MRVPRFQVKVPSEGSEGSEVEVPCQVSKKFQVEVPSELFRVKVSRFQAQVPSQVSPSFQVSPCILQPTEYPRQLSQFSKSSR